MNIYIALLRGINVSGQKKIKMDDLKSLMISLGFKDVLTYIQSGNIVFRSHLNASEIKKLIEQKIEESYKFHVPVKIISKEQFRSIVNNNPFIKKNIDLKFLYVSFLFNIPEKKNVEELKNLKFKTDEFFILETEVFINCPGGYGKTKFNNNFFEKKLDLIATTRNWKTMLKLTDLAERL